ncbi:MAG: class I SAM-dependent methyltransferase [Candidatus Omnitrophica bacterium]|nr:class I SAM-dependent methyltransferase [Candidatus Omnitrophota bacterium]
MIASGEKPISATPDRKAHSAEYPVYKIKPLDVSPAKWVWYPSQRTLTNTVIFFRKEISIPRPVKMATGWLAADSRYKLMVDGKRIQWGPAPCDPRWLEADPRVDFRNLPGGAALDVGCAVGAMVKILKRRGWNAIGVEPSVPLSELARSEHIEVQTGFLEDLEYDSGAFDLVTLMHVLEHVPHPSALVHEIARITSPGGHLLLSLPIAGTLRHYVQGAAYFDQPDHVSFFTPANIYRLLDAAGFDVIAFETPEDVVHAFDQLRQGNLPWHPVLVDRMVGWRQGSILDVFARKRKSIE